LDQSQTQSSATIHQTALPSDLSPTSKPLYLVFAPSLPEHHFFGNIFPVMAIGVPLLIAGLAFLHFRRRKPAAG
jgi:LPXTG-motif cell wall-anchored protein